MFFSKFQILKNTIFVTAERLYLKLVLTEVVIIILAILIAFTMDNYLETVKNNKVELYYLEKILNSSTLKYELEGLKTLEISFHKTKKNYNNIIKLLKVKKTYGDNFYKYLNSETNLFLYFYDFYEFLPYSNQNHYINLLLSSGDFRHVKSPEIQITIDKIGRIIEALQFANKREIETFNNMLVNFAYNQLSIKNQFFLKNTDFNQLSNFIEVELIFRKSRYDKVLMYISLLKTLRQQIKDYLKTI